MCDNIKNELMECKIQCFLIKKLKEREKTQSWLARRTGSPPSTINRLAHKIENPHVYIALIIAHAVGCDAEDIWALD